MCCSRTATRPAIPLQRHRSRHPGRPATTTRSTAACSPTRCCSAATPTSPAWTAPRLPFVRTATSTPSPSPMDGLGVNYYDPTRVAARARRPAAVRHGRITSPDHRLRLADRPRRHAPRPCWNSPSDYGEALPPLWVTENGCSYANAPDADGARRRPAGSTTSTATSEAVARRDRAGADVRGYFIWTLLRQLRVGRGLPPALRTGACGLRDPGAHPEGLVRLVRRPHRTTPRHAALQGDTADRRR